MSLRPLFLLLAIPVVSSCGHAPPATNPVPPVARAGIVPQRSEAPRPVPPEVSEPIGVLNSTTAKVQEKVEACQKLELIGPPAAPAVSALIVALRQEGLLRFHAGRALFEIGSAAIPALRAEMMSGPADVHYPAADVLAKIDADADVPIDTLKERQANGSILERYEAEAAIRLENEQHEAMAGYISTEIGTMVHKLRHGAPSEQLHVLNTLSHWVPVSKSLAPIVRPLMESPSPDVAYSAADTLNVMGPAAVPQLIDALKSPDAYARRLAAVNLGPDVPLSNSVKTSPIMVILTAALGDSSPEVVTAATRSLCNYGLNAHPILVKAMKGGNETVKAEVVSQLMLRPEGFTENYVKRLHPVQTAGSSLYPPVDAALEPTEIELGRLVAPMLVKKAKEKNSVVRWRAMLALSSLPPVAVADETVEFVRISVNDPDVPSYDGESGAVILAQLGPDGVPAIVKACDGDDAKLRSAALDALSRMPAAKNDPEVVRVMTATMSGPVDSIPSVTLTWALTLTEPSPEVVRHVADIVAGYSPDDTRYALAFPDTMVQSAVEFLGHFTSQNEPAVKALMVQLKNPSAEIRIAAIKALRPYDESAKPAIPLLTRRYASSLDVESSAAAETLLFCGREGRQAVFPYYLLRLKVEEPRQSIVKSIGMIGPDAAEAVPLLQKHLADEDNDLRMVVADALGQIGPASQPAVPALVRMMDNADGGIRQSASSALIKISPAGKGLSPALMAAVYNGDRNAVLRLAAALQHADESRAMVKRLNDLAGNDPDAKVRAAARQAVVSLSPEP